MAGPGKATLHKGLEQAHAQASQKPSNALIDRMESQAPKISSVEGASAAFVV